MSEQTIQIVSQKHKVFGKVRTVTIEGEPWFFAVDVAKALGYSDTKKAIEAYCDFAKSLTISKGTILPPFEIIDESGG